MKRFSANFAGRAALAVLLAGLAAAPSLAQDEQPAEPPDPAPPTTEPTAPPSRPAGLSDLEKLRIENEELKRKVLGLERELTAAKGTIASMRKSRDGGSPAGGAPARDELPADPLSCPASMLAELKRQYQAEFGAMQDPKDDASLRLKSQRWSREAEKQARGKASWLVRFSRVNQVGQGQNATTRAMATVLDPVTQTPLGDPFTMDVPARLVQKVSQAKPDDVWQLTLTMAPRLKFNPQRSEAGSLDVPPFIGKYIELEPEYIWDALAESKKKPTP